MKSPPKVVSNCVRPHASSLPICAGKSSVTFVSQSTSAPDAKARGRLLGKNRLEQLSASGITTSLLYLRKESGFSGRPVAHDPAEELGELIPAILMTASVAFGVCNAFAILSGCLLCF